MGGGFSADCGRNNMRFSTPFGTVLRGDETLLIDITKFETK